MATVAYPHIRIESGVPVIEGTRIKVVEIVLDQLVHHWDAEEIRRQHPGLNRAQIHSALAYYTTIRRRWTGTLKSGWRARMS